MSKANVVTGLLEHGDAGRRKGGRVDQQAEAVQGMQQGPRVSRKTRFRQGGLDNFSLRLGEKPGPELVWGPGSKSLRPYLRLGG